MENHLKETVAEVKKLKNTIDHLSNLKSTVDQLGGLFETIQKAKFDLDARLDATFAGWNERLSVSEKTSTTHLAEAADRIRKLEEEFKKLSNQPPVGPSNTTGSSHFNVPSFNVSGQYGSPLSAPPPMDAWANFHNSGVGATTGSNSFGQFFATTGSTFGAAAPSAPANSWVPPPAASTTSAVPPTPSSWATAGAGTNMMPWNDKHWTVDNKPPKELRT